MATLFAFESSGSSGTEPLSFGLFLSSRTLGLFERIVVARLDDVPVFDLHVAVRFDQLGKDWVSTMTVGVLFGIPLSCTVPMGIRSSMALPVVVPMKGGDQVVDLFQLGLSRGNSMDASGVSLTGCRCR